MITEEIYYTPTIKEFHVGFECEKVIPHTEGGHQISLTNIDQKPFIIRDVFDIPTDGAALSWFRVKYLDREDIESLGFKFELQLTDRTARFKKEHLTLLFGVETGHIRLCWEGLNSCVTARDTKQIVEINYTVLFNGLLKNKSELVKQLKITERKIYDK